MSKFGGGGGGAPLRDQFGNIVTYRKAENGAPSSSANVSIDPQKIK